MIVGFIAQVCPVDTNKRILFLWWFFTLAKLVPEIGLSNTLSYSSLCKNMDMKEQGIYTSLHMSEQELSK